MTKGNWQLSFRTWENKKRQLYYTLAKSTNAFVIIRRCVLSLLKELIYVFELFWPRIKKNF